MTPTIYRVPSESVRGQSYSVAVANGEAVCDCMGFRSHGHCKHARKVTDMQEPTTAVALRESDDDDTPSTALEIIPPQALLPTSSEMSLMANIARSVIHAQGMIPTQIKTAPQALAVMLAGWELGVRPMTALRHVFIVNGKTEPSAQLMAGMARHRGIDISYPEYTHEAVTCLLERPGKKPLEVRYTLDDAKRSGQAGKGGPWKDYTRDMLTWAATKRACRLGAPDVINAIDMSSQRVKETEALMLPADGPTEALDGPVDEDAPIESTERTLATDDRDIAPDGSPLKQERMV